MLISEAFNLYRDDYMLFKAQSRRIIETHEYVKRTIMQYIGDKNIEDFNLNDLRQWHQQMLKTKSQNSIRNDLTRVRMVLRYLELRNIPCLKADLVAIPKRIDTVPSFLTEKEVEKMIDNAYCLRNKFIISLLYSSGIRLSEFLSLNRGQIRDCRFTVVGKGGKARLCFIDQRTNHLMGLYLKKRQDNCPALVISHTHQQRMTATNVQLLVKNAAKRAGLIQRVTPHTLRHSFATNFLQNNGNIRYCQEMMGHASVETTMHYTHAANYDLEKQYKQFHTT